VKNKKLNVSIKAKEKTAVELKEEGAKL